MLVARAAAAHEESGKPSAVSRFYLAWTKHNLDEFAYNPLRAKLAFALVPVELDALIGYCTFDSISEKGKPLGRVHACKYELLTLREAHTPEGQEDPAERCVIQKILIMAAAVGYVVPQVATTKIRPAWSQLPNPPRGALNSMRRVAGL